MRLARLWAVMLVTLGAVAGAAGADEPPPNLDEDGAAVESARAPSESADFGPLVTVERIEVTGNFRTAERLIRRALPIQEGDALRAGDPRFRAARFSVLALGFFYNVRLHQARGSERGKVILTVEVFERGTVTVNRIYLGTSEITPLWAGLDIGDTNLFGTGTQVSAAFVWAAESDLPFARTQLAGRLRYSDPSPLGAPVGAHATAIWQRGSEPYLSAPGTWSSADVDRAGGVAGVSIFVSSLASLILDARVERVGTSEDVPPDLVAGDSNLITATVGFERDTRPDPVLPYAGDRALIVVENGYGLQGDYEFVRVQAQYGRWTSLRGRRHIVSAHFAAGAIFGDPPRFDRFYLGDLDPLLPPRALDLVVSNREAPDFFDTGGPPDLFGDYFGAIAVEYSYRLFRGRGRLYGGHLFAGVGLVGLAAAEDTANRIIDLTFNVGLRLDTEIGVFELSLGNALGRIPF